MNDNFYKKEKIYLTWGILLSLMSCSSQRTKSEIINIYPTSLTYRLNCQIVRTSNLYNKLLATPFPETEGNFLWIIDEELKPVNDAEVWITLKDSRKQIVLSSDEGIYTIPDLAPGAYRLQIHALEYEPNVHYLLVPATGVLRRRIVLGKPGSIYMFSKDGLYPLLSPTETVTFQHKLPGPPDNDPLEIQKRSEELKQEIERIREMFPNEVNSVPSIPFSLSWPKAEGNRLKFRQAIVESEVLVTDRLYIYGHDADAIALLAMVEFWIPEEVSEERIRKVLESAEFEIFQVRKWGVSPHTPIWKMKCVYRPPLSLDFLRQIQFVHSQLPIQYIEMTHTMPMKDTDR